MTSSAWLRKNFNPRSPHGERHFRPSMRSRAFWYFNPRSPHGERPPLLISGRIPQEIFQPTLPARGATNIFQVFEPGEEISTHAPRTGSDRFLSVASCTTGAFQPTLPARGATPLESLASNDNDISTHAPRTGSDVHSATTLLSADRISTHAPRTGSDAAAAEKAGVTIAISTHAPRTGSDALYHQCTFPIADFNPRSPHGERRDLTPKYRTDYISTHAPRTGSDNTIC